MLTCIQKSYIWSETKIQICCLKDILHFSANLTSLNKKKSYSNITLLKHLKILEKYYADF